MVRDYISKILFSIFKFINDFSNGFCQGSNVLGGLASTTFDLEYTNKKKSQSTFTAFIEILAVPIVARSYWKNVSSFTELASYGVRKLRVIATYCIELTVTTL